MGGHHDAEVRTTVTLDPDVEQLLREAGYNGEPVVILQPTNFQLISDFVEVAAARMRLMVQDEDIVPMFGEVRIEFGNRRGKVQRRAAGIVFGRAGNAQIHRGGTPDSFLQELDIRKRARA